MIIATDEAACKRQVKLIGGYAAFYNPANLGGALKCDGPPCAVGESAISGRDGCPGMDSRQDGALNPAPHDGKAFFQKRRRRNNR